MKPGLIWQRRGIYLTQDFGHIRKSNMEKFCSLVNCLSPVKAEHCIFRTVEYSWMGGIRRIEQSNSRLTELCASQWYICQAELKEVNFEQICWQCHHHWKLFDSFDELLSSLEITNSKFSTSELLITSESVEHWWIFEAMDVGTQTDLSEEEQEAHLLKDYGNTLLEMLDEIKSWDQEAYWDIIIETLFKCFARENRDKRTKEPDFQNLDRLEALEDEHREQCTRWSKSWSKAGTRVDRIWKLCDIT